MILQLHILSTGILWPYATPLQNPGSMPPAELAKLRIREFQDEITRLKMQLEKRGGPGSPQRPPPQEGEEVVVETEVVEVEKNLGHVGIGIFEQIRGGSTFWTN